MEPHRPAPLANVMDLLLDAICVVDKQGRFVFVSAACERIFGYTPQEMVGRPMIEFVHAGDQARTLGVVEQIVAGEPKPNFENRYVRKDGRTVHIMWSARWSEADQVRVAVARDVTERKHAESMQAALYAISEAAHAAQDLLELFPRIHEIIGGLLPAKNFFVALYDAAHDRLSFPYHVDELDPAPQTGPLAGGTLSGEVIRSGKVLVRTRDSAAAAPGASHPQAVEASVEQVVEQAVEPWLGQSHEPVAADVGPAAVDWLGVPLVSQSGTIGALVVKSRAGDTRYTAADIELLKFVSTQVAAAIERKQTDSWLRHVARHDPLTDLPNRSLLRDRMDTALARARRDGTRLSLLYLDLDGFKDVNDRFGHAVGDHLLRDVALRLTGCVRESDTVGRMGGDEFVVLLSCIRSAEAAALVAEKIRAALCQPFDLAGLPLTTSPSMGIAHYPEHGDDGDTLIRCADQAMYAAKHAGGNRFAMAPWAAVAAGSVQEPVER